MQVMILLQNNLTIGDEDLPEEAFTLLSVLLVGFLLLILVFLSVAGNVLVCVAIYTDRGLRRIGNLFLASLAIADLFVGCLVMTFAGVNDLLGYWVFGTQFCDTWIAFDVMCSTASILNLCAISLDRYIHIKDPLRYGRWVTRRIATAGIAVVWLLAGLISFVPISLGLHRADQFLVYDDGKEEHPTCALDLTPTYAVVSSCISFYVPCMVMLGIYCRLYCYAQKHVKSIRAVTKIPEVSVGKSFRTKSRYKPPKPQMKSKPTSPYHVSDHKAAITVGVIMGVFLICWVPFFCVNIVAAYCKTCISVQAFQVLTWLGYSNSAFNPIIYSIFNTEFREAFKRILTKGVRSRGNQPSTSECGEFRSIVIQKHNGSMIECNISPRSSADSSHVGVIAQMHPHPLIVILLLFVVTERSNCDDKAEWYFGLRSALKNCPSMPWNNLSQDDFFDVFRQCIQQRALNFLDSLLVDDIIPVIDGIDLIRFQDNSTSLPDEMAKKESMYNETEDTSNWTGIVLNRLTGILRTHVLKIDVDHIVNTISSPMNETEIDRSDSNNTVQGRRRRHRRRHNVMPLMMMGLLLMGSILVPMGFQFLAVLGGKALLLAKMALLLSSIQGLKKIATNGVNYGLYHAPVSEAWHERSHQETPTHFDLPYPIHAQTHA
ncbi:D(1)-like dopamine receptor isoform X2 [Vespa velutina]|uniref:D(1)-like dopamine receptor isoform X2 n=1 Tax=Vespa velutina TaxID=202808 RepID=UPI001FB4F562|nr:D(1)-like dopamine receptor isoform X2 [Vespa velutina]